VDTSTIVSSGDQTKPRASVDRSRGALDRLPQGRERVLLAEDDPLLRRSTALLLRDLGYHVTACADGAEALAAAARDDLPIDLLFTDFAMPGMTGYELAQRIQVERPDIRVLMTSGWAPETILPPADSPIPFIGKPFTLHALAHKLREVLDG
jgi:two-component system, cell cycle sensor histidine kinase and response regulator CckA